MNLFIPHLAHAQAQITVSLPVGMKQGGTLDGFLSILIGVGTTFAFIYYLFQVIIAGYGFLSSEGDKGKIEAARNRLSQGVIGLIIIVAAVVFVNLIGFILGVEKFSIDQALKAFQ